MADQRTGWRIALICGCSLWATCAVAQPAPADTDLLPLLQVSRDDAAQSSTTPVGGYVRFWIEKVDADITPNNGNEERAYGSERRDWVSRFFVGRSQARVLTARLVVNRANPITQTVTLASASHDSNRRQGENWSTELAERRFLTPFIRVDQGTTASVEVSLSVSARIDPDITRNVLSIIERGARLAAPTAPLVTALNSSRLTESSDFIDTSISRLFGEAIVERSQNDFPADSWNSGRSIALISARFPMERHVWGPSPYVGFWRVHVSQPIVSIFAPVPLHAPAVSETAQQICPQVSPQPDQKRGAAERPSGALIGEDRQACLAFVGLVPSRVLGLTVGENVTLGQALRSDTSITAALQRFGSASNKTEAGREICVLVAEKAEALGLNAYDGAAALWAFASNGGIASSMAGQIWTGDCAVAQLAQRLGLNLSLASATQSSPGGNQNQNPPPPTPGPVTSGQTPVTGSSPPHP